MILCSFYIFISPSKLKLYKAHEISMHISQVQYSAARLRSRTKISVLQQATSYTAATHASYPARTHVATTHSVPASITRPTSSTIRMYRHLIANSLCISSTAQAPHIEHVSATISRACKRRRTHPNTQHSRPHGGFVRVFGFFYAPRAISGKCQNSLKPSI